MMHIVRYTISTDTENLLDHNLLQIFYCYSLLFVYDLSQLVISHGNQINLSTFIYL